MFTVNRTVSVAGKNIIEDLPIFPHLVFPDLETAKNSLYHYLMKNNSHPLNLMIDAMCDSSKKSDVINNFLDNMNIYKVGVGGHLNRYTFSAVYVSRVTEDKEITYSDTFFIQELHVVSSIKEYK